MKVEDAILAAELALIQGDEKTTISTEVLYVILDALKEMREAELTLTEKELERMRRCNVKHDSRDFGECTLLKGHVGNHHSKATGYSWSAHWAWKK